MIETLVGVSPSNTEDLLEAPCLADAAVVGVKGSGEPEDPADLAEPSSEGLAIVRELVRSARTRRVVERLVITATSAYRRTAPTSGR